MQDARQGGIRIAAPRFHDVPQGFAVDLFAQLVVQLQRRTHAADAVVAQLHTVVVEGKPHPVGGCDKRLGRRIAAHHLGAQLDARRQGCGVTVLLGKQPTSVNEDGWRYCGLDGRDGRKLPFGGSFISQSGSISNRLPGRSYRKPHDTVPGRTV